MRAHAALALVVFAGCATLRDRPAAPLPPEIPAAPLVAARVEGVVTDRWGYIVPDTWITVRVGSPHAGGAGDPDCEGAAHLPTRTRGGVTGEFAVVVQAGQRAPFHACLEVEALPPPNTGLRENRRVVPSVAFTHPAASGAGEPVRVHIVLY